MYWKKRFDKSALNFENDADIGLGSKHGFERRFVTFFRVFQENYLADEVERKKLLDIGCGTGAYTKQLADMGYDVVGIDFSEYVIKRAVEKSNKKNIPYTIGALPFLPFKEKSFDIVVCIGVFQSIDDCSATINDIRKVLKENDGVLMLVTLNSLSMRTFYKKISDIFLQRNKNREKEMVSVKRYNPFNLKQMFRDKCFDSIEIIPIYIFPKMLIPFEKLFEKNGIFQVLDKVPIVSVLIAHAFIISAVRIKNDQKPIKRGVKNENLN